MPRPTRKTPPRTPTGQHASYQDVLDADPRKVAEIISGTLHTHPRPAPPHALASSGLGYEVTGPFGRGIGGPGGWWILDEPELHVQRGGSEEVVVPDLAGWRRERMAHLPASAYFTIAPDWVCEVLSPSTRQLDHGPKRGIYAREGVGYLWFVDPDARTLEAFRLEDGQWCLIASLSGDDAVSVPPFEAISFDLSGLWIPEPEPGAG